MKKCRILLGFALIILVVASGTASCGAVVIAHWKFSDLTTSGLPVFWSTSPQTINPEIGSGDLVAVSSNSTANFSISASNSPFVVPDDGSGRLAFNAGANNWPGSLTITVSTIGLMDIQFGMDSVTSLNRQIGISVSSNGVDFDTVGNTGNFSWNRENWDLSAMDALENNSQITFLLGNSYTATAFDEILITGTPIPEPGPLPLVLLACGLCFRRTGRRLRAR